MPPRLAIAARPAHSARMESSHKDYRYRLRKYPRRGGIVWRWWIFDGKDAHHSDTGVIAGTGRDQAEAAAMNAIEQRRGRNPARRPDGTVLGVVGPGSPEASGGDTSRTPT